MRIKGKIRKNKNTVSNADSKINGIDWPLMLVVLILVVLGLIMQYSASDYNNKQIVQQAGIAAAGMITALCISFIPAAFWNKVSVIAYIASVFLCIACRFIGTDANMGAKRWIRFGSIGIQPSELLKIGLILALAAIICKNFNDINNQKEVKFLKIISISKEEGFGHLLKTHKGYLLSSLFIVIAAGVVAIATKDLGTAIIIFGIGYAILLIISPRIKYLIIAAIGALGLAGIFVLLFPYRIDRITAWIHQDTTTSDIGYQVRQGLYAIGSGGLLGRGLGKSIQKEVIPEAHTDMIFSILCEELGIIGGCLVIALFIILILRLKKIYSEVNDLFAKLVVAGVASHLAIQAFINMGVLTGLIPNTGVPLPFISYGGSSLFCLLLEIGIVLSVRRNCLIKGKSICRV